MRTAKVLFQFGVLALGGGIFVLGFVLGQSPSLVSWSHLKPIVIESDDWGLAGFSPSADAWNGIDRQDLAPGRFPEVYWNSTLEDSSTVARMASIMARYTGRDGLPAVFQPNYVMGSQDWVPSPEPGHWQEYSWPELPPQYKRPGLASSVKRSIARGVWYPELHARWHYDPDMRHQNALTSETAILASRRGITLFPNSEGARELGPWRSSADLERELTESRQIFARFFGRWPDSIIAPDYTWNSRLEKMWSSQGITVIQAKREQRNPELGYGMAARLKKFVYRRLAIVGHAHRQYLERNVRLEPVQAPDHEKVIQQAFLDTHLAWRRNQPAIVETHRVNFAHWDTGIQQTGMDALARYLSLVTEEGREQPVFLTDREVAGLARTGVSWVRRGSLLIVRNATHGAKVVSLPQSEFEPDALNEDKLKPVLIKVPGMTTLISQNKGSFDSLPLNR